MKLFYIVFGIILIFWLVCIIGVGTMSLTHYTIDSTLFGVAMYRIHITLLTMFLLLTVVLFCLYGYILYT